MIRFTIQTRERSERVDGGLHESKQEFEDTSFLAVLESHQAPGKIRRVQMKPIGPKTIMYSKLSPAPAFHQVPRST